MLEVTISEGPKAHIIESPIPTPRENEVVIKVVVSGSNPKDWKFPKVNSSNKNEGDDIAGIVHQVGKNVLEFKVRMNKSRYCMTTVTNRLVCSPEIGSLPIMKLALPMEAMQNMPWLGIIQPFTFPRRHLLKVSPLFL